MEYSWKILDDYFKSNKYFLTKHHIDSYNDFVVNKITNTIKLLNPIIMLKNQDDDKLSHEVNIYIGGENGKNIYINKPTIVEGNSARVLYPNEARLKDMTYQSELFADITVKYVTKEKGKSEKIEEELIKQIKIGAIPIMLHSRLCVLNNQTPDIIREMGDCIYDQGGYFIIDGKEKVIVAQERIGTNRMFINKSKEPNFSHEALIRCTSEENPLFPKTINFYVYNDDVIDKIKESSEHKFLKIRNAILIEVPNIDVKIPICVLFRALGIESDKDMLKHIVYDINNEQNNQIIDFFRYSIVQGLSDITNQEEAFTYLTNFVEYKNVDKVRHVLIYDLFPNVGHSFKNKALFLGHILRKLIKVALGAAKESDRDSYIFKRVDVSGFLIGNLFRDYYNQFRNTIRNKLDNEYLYGHWRQSKVIKNLVNKSNINKIFRFDIIEDGMKKSLKGMWGRSMLEEQQDMDLIKQGIVQDLSRISYLGTISHLRRVNTPMDPTAKIVEPHRLHTTQWGIMCPCESPDGASIGLLKNMAIMCHVTFDYSVQNIMKLLQEYGDIVFMNNIIPSEIENINKLLINNNWVGVVKDPVKLYRFLKLCKRNALINIFTSISWNVLNYEINILTEAGRCCRPLYVVQQDKLLIYDQDIANNTKIKWNELLCAKDTKNFDPLEDKYINPFELFKTKDIDSIIEKLNKTQAPIEYIDAEEANCALIAMNENDIKIDKKSYTYCEIHPSTIFSVVTHTIPLANYNQAPRNIFSGAQSKQAIGWYATNFNNRIDTMSFMLHYPQKCLVNTRYMEYMNMNKLPNGANLIVAIATYTGYNQEDAILMNKNSVERGLFNLTYFKNIIDVEEEDSKGLEKIIFVSPLELANKANLTKIKYGNYKKIDENGFPIINEYIKEDDVIIGKCKVITQLKDEEGTNNIFGNKVKIETFEDKSLIADKTVSGIIDKVFVYKDNKGDKNCKIRMRKIKLPEPGDKCCSRHAQKGVIGMLLKAEDMPFTKDGIIPDIIINPHGIPTRMTIAHLLECLLGKVGTMNGNCIDGTPFCNENHMELFESLEKNYGLERYGNEIMYNGVNGYQMQSDIFIGPIFYERLKHMVSDKINYRRDGPVSMLTRQPVKGRSQNGGLRIGEMEKDSILSHGAMSFLKESMMERGDNYNFKVSNKFNFIANDYNSFDNENIRAPYSMKTALQEIMALGVKPILYTEEIEEEDNQDDFDTELFPINEEVDED